MTKEGLDKQLAGQGPTTYMSLKTDTSKNHKSITFDENKLLKNQIEKLA